MKRVLVTLSVLLCLNVSAQEQLFFFGFEDGMASFTDSANAFDSITQIQYYSHQGSNGSGLKPEEFELGPIYDTTMLVLNGIAPMGSRGDSYDIIEDLEGQHKGEFEAMSAHGGVRYFRYMAGGELGGTACNDYEANLFVRALPIRDYTSYRLSMYVKASSKEGQLNIDLMRGFNNSDRQLSMTGDQYSGEFKLSKKKFTTNRWERVTMMAYYQNDSVANRYMYQSGYWWTNNWKKNIDGTDYNMIVQPDHYFARLAFMGPGVTYYVDDISLTQSWIGGAEYSNNIMRVDFGYDTNLAELANATSLNAIKLPTEYVKISGIDNYTGDYYDEIPVSAAEYHSDGYLYIWIDQDDSFKYYEDVRVSFKNPEDKALQLKYDGGLYPMALDTIWVNAGKIVPDFAAEPAFYNSSVSALTIEQIPPSYVSSEPEDGSFNLESSMSSFDVTFNKKVFVKLNQYDPSDTTSVIVVMRAAGSQEIWVPTAYNAETYTVTFSRQEGNTSSLGGDYEFDIVQARATARTPQAEKKTITLNFGESDVPTEVLTRIDFLGFNKGITNIDGLKVNESCMMEVAEFKGLYTRALKFGLFGANLQNGAPVLTYTFNVSEAGTWYVKYGTSGCLKNSWNDGCKMVVTVIDPVSTDTLDIYTEEKTNNWPEEGGVVSKVDEQVRTVNFPAAGEYQVVFTLPNENSWGGGHKGGRVLYYIEVSNSISNSGLYTFLDDPLAAKDLNGNLLNQQESVPLGFMKKDAAGEKVGDGVASSGESRMHYYAEGGEFLYGMYFSPRGGSADSYLNYGAVDGYELTLPAEKVKIKFNLAGWDTSNPLVKFYVYKKGETKNDAIFSSSITTTQSIRRGDMVLGSTCCEYIVDIPEVGNYILEWSHESSTWDGSVLGALNVTNVVSKGTEYILAYNKAIKTAKELIEKASAELCYTGSYLNDFMNIIASKEHFVSTSPTAYENIVAEIYEAITNMKNRIDNVDNYYATYQDILDMNALYQDSKGYNELLAFTQILEVIAKYNDLDITVKNNEELNVIIAEINETIQTMINRCTSIDEFDANIAKAEALLTDYELFSKLDLYKSLLDVYNANINLAKFSVSDDILNTINKTISTAVSILNGKMNAASILTTQVKDLAEMADALVSNWGIVDVTTLAEQLALELEDNQELANIYQLAIKATIETLMAEGSLDENGMDMSLFIQNNNLYTSGTNHKVNENENPLPGWNVSNIRGNVYFGLPWDNQAANAEKPTVNTWLGIDWNSGVTMSQTLKNLPAGRYTVECGFSSRTAQGSFLIEQFDTDGTLVQSDTFVWESDKELIGEANLNQAFQFEAQGVTTVITADAFSSGSWGGFDKWALTLNEPIKGYDYASASYATIRKLNNLYFNTSHFYKIEYYVDGNLYHTEYLKYGSTVPDLDLPEKEGYTIVWDTDIPEIMPENDMRINISYSLKEYVVDYYLDGELYQTASVAYGSEIPQIVIPEKEGHTIVWNTDIPETMPANDLRINISYSLNEYVVDYYLDGELYQTARVPYGSEIPQIVLPEKEGYTIVWDTDIPETMPAGSIIINGTFIFNKDLKFNVIYMLDGKEYKRIVVSYTDPVPVEETIEKEGYTFSGWSEIPETMPMNDVYITGEFEVNYYLVDYYIDGNLYLTEYVAYGAEIPRPEIQLSGGVIFSDWQDVPETMPAYDIIVLGQYIDNAIHGKTDTQLVDVYTIDGVLIAKDVELEKINRLVKPGIYIVSGKQVLIKD